MRNLRRKCQSLERGRFRRRGVSIHEAVLPRCSDLLQACHETTSPSSEARRWQEGAEIIDMTCLIMNGTGVEDVEAEVLRQQGMEARHLLHLHPVPASSSFLRCSASATCSGRRSGEATRCQPDPPNT